MRLAVAMVVAVSLVVPLAARASGAHDAVGCSGCHPLKGSGGWFVLGGNRKYLDPATNRPYTGTTAVCLACHQTKEAGGRGNAPIFRHLSHPFAVAPSDPRRAKVPEELLVNGKVECMSCHDPHPANSNVKYLRGDLGPNGSVDRFCATCHPSKAG